MKYMIKKSMNKLLFSVATILAATNSDAQQLEFNSASYSTTNGPVTAAGPATFRKNVGTSGTFSAHSPATTFSVTISNQQYTGGAVPGVTIGKGTSVFQTMNATGSPSSHFFTSSPNIATAGTNFDVATNAGFMFAVESKYQYDYNQPLNARNYYANVTINFSRAVINPVLHFSGMGGGTIVTTYNTSGQLTGEGIVGFYSEFELTPSDISNGISLTRLSGNNTFTVNSGTKIVNTNTQKSINGGYYNTQQYASAGSVRVNSGNTPITSVTFRIYLRGDGGTGYPSDWNWSTCVDEWMLSASLGMANLSGTVYEDNNGMIGGVNGNPMSNVTVGLYESNGTTLLGTTTTDAGGYYLFTEIPGGPYVVKVTSPEHYTHVSSTDATPTDGSTNVKLDGITNVTGVDFGLNVTNPVSVQLLDFDVQVNSFTMLLQWSTASELNSRGFDIERSADGGIWNSIGFAPSKAYDGNSSNKLDYFFIDVQPQSGTNYYRLKQIDHDGSAYYSGIRIVSFKTQNGINVYPNPANDYVIISGLNGSEKIEVYDIMGKYIKEIVGEDSDTKISLQGLPGGVYNIVIAHNTGNRLSVQIVKN